MLPYTLSETTIGGRRGWCCGRTGLVGSTQNLPNMGLMAKAGTFASHRDISQGIGCYLSEGGEVLGCHSSTRLSTCLALPRTQTASERSSAAWHRFRLCDNNHLFQVRQLVQTEGNVNEAVDMVSFKIVGDDVSGKLI